MAKWITRVNADGESVTIPREVREWLHLQTGSPMEWYLLDGKVFVSTKSVTFQEMHDVLFDQRAGVGVDVTAMNDGIEECLRERHARD
jgi:bifunctional DNA-binding transcriptional regulator/antitoxin component of YhaV-PrlF toxin-antitoxin module